LPSGVKLVGAAFAIWLVIPANDGDRRLAAASEPTSLLGGWFFGGDRRVTERGTHWCIIVQREGAAHPVIRRAKVRVVC
jgi:hypothetical protein